MDKFARTLFWPLIMLAALTGVVFAADIPADPSANPQGAFQQFWDAIVSHRWGLAAVIATMLFVAFARFIAPRIHGNFGVWVQSSRVSAALAFLGGTTSALAGKLMLGSPWSLNILVYGFGIGVAAIGGYNAFWDLLFPADKKPADKKLAIPPPPPVRPGLLLPLALGLSVFAVGCAHGTDGLRQVCANANVTLTQVTVTGTALYKLGHQELRAKLTKENADATQAKANSYNIAFDKFLATMTMISATKTTVCDTADAIDAGEKKDIPTLVTQAGKIVIDAAAALAELQKFIDTATKTSGVNRRLALAYLYSHAAVL